MEYSIQLTLLAFLFLPGLAFAQVDPGVLKVGIIGLDTSHSIAFTRLLNDSTETEFQDLRVVVAYPHGSADIKSSVSRIPGYMKEIADLGVDIVDSIDELIERVDVVLLETNDGRPHYAQVEPVLKAGKTVFVDKPIAASLIDAIRIFETAEAYDVPLFSSSSLRFMENAQAIRAGKIGDVLGAETYSPATLEPTHPDLFWYGIHGVETLFTVMGTGCETVQRVATPDTDLVTGIWKDGRIGTFRGIRSGEHGYGGRAFGSEGIHDIGPYEGYRPLVSEIATFFRTGIPPVSAEETLEIYAFMEAADESKRRGGAPVSIESVLRRARETSQNQ